MHTSNTDWGVTLGSSDHTHEDCRAAAGDKQQVTLRLRTCAVMISVNITLQWDLVGNLSLLNLPASHASTQPYDALLNTRTHISTSAQIDRKDRKGLRH